jgi:addiction module HigA family antidote
MIRVPTDRVPTHPGEMLLEEFLTPMRLSQRDLALGIRVPYQRVNELVNGKRGVTPSTALRLARYFGNSPGFWLSLQQRWDLYHAEKAEATDLKRIDAVSASCVAEPRRQTPLSPQSARRVRRGSPGRSPQRG